MNKSFWNTRYLQTESSYGINPNEFYKEQLLKIEPGKILLPGEGEGRNALFAAELGWNVTAVDFSEVAREKALNLVRMKNLLINYQIADLGSIKLPIAQYDVVGLIYVHLPVTDRKHLHGECIKSLKSGGTVILEAFSKNQVNYSSGGPKDSNLLYALHEIQEDFHTLEVDVIEERTILLEEGIFHKGLASVVRLAAHI
jgi:SAM-dependent methyltransferase